MRNFYLLIVYCMLILSSALSASAIGIGPPRIKIDFEPNLEIDIEYFVVNTIQSPVNVDMYVKGDLKEYIAFDKTSFKLNPGKTQVIVVHLALPEKIDRPGTNDIRIGALESPIGADGAMVAAKAGVESQLYIEVPYEGKYLSANIAVESVRVGETAELIIGISNLGKEDISSVSAVIDIYDSDDKKIDTVSADKKELKAGETSELKAQWDTKDAKPGTYQAAALIDYDGNEKEIRTSFNVGDVLIEIVALKTNEFSPGEIAKFILDVESKWNEKITDIYAVIEIYENGRVIGSAESKKIDISAWGKEQIEIFWDSTGIGFGEYKVKTILHYKDKTSEKSFDIEVKKKGNLWIIVLIGAVILLIAYLAWSKWGRKSKEKEQ
ncbi:hypothetical protein GOV06_05275 [Candidatus Woesearchaeota archaeon]|nr:hypothetical protein [Candidatus Woesearchaeota archaeon]